MPLGRYYPSMAKNRPSRAKNRLLQALEADNTPRKFTCPRTGVELEIHLPSRAMAKAARVQAQNEWGSREVNTVSELEEYQTYQREQLLARCAYLDGQPVGLETIRALDEGTLRQYDAELGAIEDERNPPLESWTQEQVQALIGDIQKKDAGIEGRLRTFGVTRLVGLVLFMGALLSKSATSNSSTSCSGTENG